MEGDLKSSFIFFFVFKCIIIRAHDQRKRDAWQIRVFRLWLLRAKDNERSWCVLRPNQPVKEMRPKVDPFVLNDEVQTSFDYSQCYLSKNFSEHLSHHNQLDHEIMHHHWSSRSLRWNVGNWLALRAGDLLRFNWSFAWDFIGWKYWRMGDIFSCLRLKKDFLRWWESLVNSTRYQIWANCHSWCLRREIGNRG